jgi:uncharacterized membrane protein YraQ (UPF0718 family)
MDYASLTMWAIAVVVAVIALFRPGKLYLEGMRLAWEQTRTLLPKVALALLVSGFFSALIPTELVAAWLGKESGLKGVLIGSLVGGFVPGGPIICFPIVVILFRSGAGVAPLIALITAWSIYAFHRLLTYEIPLMGVRFAVIRMVSSLILPPLAGLMVLLLEAGGFV